MRALHDVAAEMSGRAVLLTDRLCAAFSTSHRRIGLTSRKDSRGRDCQYPVGEDWCGSLPRLPEGLALKLVAEYHSATDIPPDKCMVVSWIDGLSCRVEYAWRPDEWHTNENAAQPEG